MIKGGTEGYVGGTKPPLNLTVSASGVFLELSKSLSTLFFMSRINDLIHAKNWDILVGCHGLAGFPKSTIATLIAKYLSSLVEELQSSELGKETVVRGQESKEFRKFIRLCLWGGDKVGAGHRLPTASFPGHSKLCL